MADKKEIFTEGSIGGMVLEALTTGLYSDNLNCLREYIQNSRDEGATRVDIDVDNGGRRIYITDDGPGMNEAGLIEALRLGISTKGGEDAGWRGIGIWSGVGLCDRLDVVTKKAGHPVSRASIDCSVIKDRNRLRDNDLVDLMNDMIIEMRTEGEPDDSHYTKVTLSDIPPSISNQYVNHKTILEFVERTVPLNFKESFALGDKITSRLREHVGEGRKCLVFVDGKEAFKVPYDSADILQTVHFEEFHSSDGDLFAIGWFVFTNTNRELSFGGLNFRKKGFRIGDTSLVTAMAMKKFIPWTYGEIHIVSPKIVENASRDGLNRGVDETEQLLRKVGDFSDSLEQLIRAISKNLGSATLDKGKELLSKGKVVDAKTKFRNVEKRKANKPSATITNAFPDIVKEILLLKDVEQNEVAKLLNSAKTSETVLKSPARSPTKVQPPTSERKTLIPDYCPINIKSTRTNNLYHELMNLGVEQFPNSASVAFRVFLELSVDEYVKTYNLPIHERNDSLESRLRTIIDDILKNGNLSKDEKEDFKLKKNRLKYDIFTNLNKFIHSPIMEPEENELKIRWDDIEPIIKMMWEICSGDRARDPDKAKTIEILKSAEGIVDS